MLKTVQQIAKVSKARKSLTRVLVTSSDNKKTTIVSFLSAARLSGNAIKLGYVVKPWGSGQFLHQIRNLFCEITELCSRIDREIRECVEETNFFPGKNRLILGVTEQDDGLRIELGNDHHTSMESDTINDYLEQLEENIFFSPVEYIICGVSQLDRRSPDRRSDNKNTTILSFLSAERPSGSSIKLGYVVKPWGSGQFLQQIRNLFSGNTIP